MADEMLISKFERLLTDIVIMGGKSERTVIVPGILVVNANPSDLPAGWIKIVNPRDGTYVPCQVVAGLVVSDNDLVNVLFVTGSEPVALSQSSQSPSSSVKVSELWESDFGAVAWQTDASGHLSATGKNLTTTGDIGGADITASDNVMADAHGFIVKNTSGAAAAAGDAGYLDENNEYKTTTTSSFQAANPVVVLVGAADNSDIYVTSGPGRAIVNYVGTAPTTGQRVVFSTTAGKVASAGGVMSPAVLAQARANGSGGTVEIELLCSRVPVPFSSASSALFVNGANDSDFVAAISAAGVSGDKVYHDPPSSGNQNCVTPFSTGDLAKIVLHNTTRGETAFIIAAGTDGTDDFIQVSAAADIAAWSSGDAITTRSQTNTTVIGTSRWFDLEITSSEIPETAVAIVANVSYRDTGAVDNRCFTHPFEANSNAKRQNTLGVSTSNNLGIIHIVPLIQRRFCVLWEASGTGTAIPLIRVQEIIVAT